MTIAGFAALVASGITIGFAAGVGFAAANAVMAAFSKRD